MQAYKIDVRALTEQQKKDVQEAFFKMGYSWGTDSVEFLDKDYYYAEGDGGMTYGITWEVYNNNNYTKITYTKLMTLVYGDNTMNTQKEFTKAAFTKSDLKDGVFVRLKNGNIYIHTKGNLLSHSGWMQLESYKEDLSHSCDDYWSIGHVMELKADSKRLGNGLSKSDEFEYEYIWSRSEQTEQQKQLAELKTAQEELLLKAKEIGDKIVALQQGN